MSISLTFAFVVAFIPCNVPGQVLLLHTLASVLAPKQLDPPVHERCLLDLPPPQLLVQVVQDPQFDQVTSAENGNSSTYATSILAKVHLDNCWCYTVFLLS